MTNIRACLLALPLLAGCDLGAEVERAAPPRRRVDAAGDVVLTAEERGALDLRVEVAVAGSFATTTLRLGVVTAAPSDEALVVASIAGRLSAPRVAPGDTVAAGAELVTLEPLLDPLALQALRTQTLEVEGQLAAARARLVALEGERDRVRELLGLSLATPAELKRADADLEGEQAHAASLARMAEVQARALDGPIALIAPIAGRVVEVLARAGDVVAQGTRLARIVADGRRRVALSVPPGDAPATAYRVHREDGAGADAADHARERREPTGDAASDAAVDAALLATGALVGPDGTRTDLLLLSTGAGLLPGQTVAVDVVRERAGVRVPAGAIVRRSGEAVLFVEVADGTYRARAVQVAARDERSALLAAGLEPGERVVVQGAASLLGELGYAQVATPREAER